jgi:alkylation response protein AidB-like acyl-CoA dehydrogenase
LARYYKEDAMDFDFSESQQILKNTARSFLEKEAKDLAREMEKTEKGYSVEMWQKMANLGWMGVIHPEQYGGIEGNYIDLIAIIEEMGRALFPGPFMPSQVAGLSILQYGTDAQKSKLLSPLITGEIIVTTALHKPDADLSETRVKDRVEIEDDVYVISGTRLFVPYGNSADWFIYHADTSEGPAQFLVDAKSAGIEVRPLPTIADMQTEIVLEGVKVSKENVVATGDRAQTLAKDIEQWGSLFYCAFISGLLEKVLEMTVQHAKEREQFDRPIGSFQAIQHQCADMATEIDKVKFLTYQAAWKLSEQIPAAKDISMAKARASDASRNVSLLGVKIHGGVGISEEHDMQLYFRRAKASEVTFGDGDFHREIVARHLGL